METLWQAVLSSLELPGAEECCQALVVVQQYIDDVCKSPLHILRLTDACFARMTRVWPSGAVLLWVSCANAVCRRSYPHR